jgi:hypothetical protein
VALLLLHDACWPNEAAGVIGLGASPLGFPICKNFITSAADTASCVLWSRSGLGGCTILLISPLRDSRKDASQAHYPRWLDNQPNLSETEAEWWAAAREWFARHSAGSRQRPSLLMGVTIMWTFFGGRDLDGRATSPMTKTGCDFFTASCFQICRRGSAVIDKVKVKIAWWT